MRSGIVRRPWLFTAMLCFFSLASQEGATAESTPPRAGTEAGSETGKDTFLRGVDISLLAHLEQHGVVYRDGGKARDALLIFRDHDVNFARLRLFVHPDGTIGQVNTLAYTLALGKRVKDAGLGFLLDLHYSDQWADPGHQNKPAAWKGLPFEKLVEQVQAYTREVLTACREKGCAPDMVQIGNEITGGFLWDDGRPKDEAGWERLTALLKAGVRGVREGTAQGRPPRIMIHLDRGGDKGACKWFYENITRRGVEFEVIGLSYYPFWHGTMEDLKANLAFLAETFRKDIVVVETGHDWRGQGQEKLPFPATPEGQRAFMEKLIRTIRETPGQRGTGVVYWAPEWIRGDLWSAGKGSGDWERRAFFDQDGNALPVLKAFEKAK